MVLAQMQGRRGTAAQWASANPVLAAGEFGWESDTNKAKIGNGGSTWSALPYFPNVTGLLSTGDLTTGDINSDDILAGDITADSVTAPVAALDAITADTSITTPSLILPYIELNANATTSIPHNTITTVSFPAATHNDAAYFSQTGSVITITVAGKYTFNYSASFATSIQYAGMEFAIRKNGASPGIAKAGCNNTTDWSASPALDRYTVAAGDTFQLVAYQFQFSGSSAVNVAATSRLIITKVE